MNDKELKALGLELSKSLKTPEDLNQLCAVLKKISIQAALGAELRDQLGYDNGEARTGTNSRNGYSSKTVLSGDGELETHTPRDREGSFEPQLVKKHQRRITSMDDQILALYAKGMTNREIVEFFKELYDADVSPTLISKVTDTVLERVVAWQNRPLDALYPVVYLDCIVVKIRHNNQVVNKSVYLALGINLQDHKELLGLWIAQSEGAKFWLGVITELQTRGLKDILIACVYGLKGFPEAINAIESLNSVIRHVTNKRKIFPSDGSARKIIYLAVMNASNKWTIMPIQNWREAMNWFMIEFDERINAYL